MSTTEALEPAAMPADVIERHIEGIAAHTLPAATYDALRAVSESDRYNVTCVNSCGASRAKPPNHSSALARAPRPD
jgi:hypothetical protein